MINYPDVAAFDLDYTLWPCFCDTHLTPPFTPVKLPSGEVQTIIDSCGRQISLYPDIPDILSDLKTHGTLIVSASRTWAPDIAKQMLACYKIRTRPDGPPIPLLQIFDALSWGDHPKINHIRDALRTIHDNTNNNPHGTANPAHSLAHRDLSDIRSLKICLFDDEPRNRDVEAHGVSYVHVRDRKRGTTWDLYQAFLAAA
ncbi:Mg-dependent acid phosphatase Ecym_6198 [Eremothecium cymbalariae DBVPG|uniref:Magnesium-dependent phosphatase-1 n=1 Tax=Eremothecium cymbalariae (strain CBS 270.75 / DBVPG 7215 / KCTC 17166 / NRRL Y-17582) TaxID=931890 RepID=G8JVA2_ERECY|nr:hypothetical protein Ecym_6198 [Eremothecium cymbalariae DBVPG\